MDEWFLHIACVADRHRSKRCDRVRYLPRFHLRYTFTICRRNQNLLNGIKTKIWRTLQEDTGGFLRWKGETEQAKSVLGDDRLDLYSSS
ncbi:hypothetical protein AAC387_Pa03g1200 [Persea americana]